MLGEIAVPKKRIKAALKLLDLVPDAAAGASPKGSTLPDATTERGRSILSGVMNDESAELATRLAAAKALLPYSFRPDDGDEAPISSLDVDDWVRASRPTNTLVPMYGLLGAAGLGAAAGGGDQ